VTPAPSVPLLATNTLLLSSSPPFILLLSPLSFIKAIKSAGLHPDQNTYTHVTNLLVRSVEFVAGAVSMESLPTKKLPEAVFIGR